MERWKPLSSRFTKIHNPTRSGPSRKRVRVTVTPLNLNPDRCSTPPSAPTASAPPSALLSASAPPAGPPSASAPSAPLAPSDISSHPPQIPTISHPPSLMANAEPEVEPTVEPLLDPVPVSVLEPEHEVALDPGYHGPHQVKFLSIT